MSIYVKKPDGRAYIATDVGNGLISMRPINGR